MKGCKAIIYLVLALFIANIANAAAIYGSVYDLSLKKVNNAMVEINTVPRQLVVAQNGTYSFNVPNGRYTLKASLLQKSSLIASVEENITIAQDGSYVLDLIMFPELEEGVENISLDINGNVLKDNKNNNKVLIFALIAMFISGAAAAIYFLRIRKKDRVEDKKAEVQKESQDDDLEQVIKIIKQEGGRATQKDIRKEIPLSEAKVSLMIAELEHKGIVEKIKKGRGNIIILKKK